jgi:CheY-like chemotaxis protein
MAALRVDAVVVDLVMPGMSGLDLIERLRTGAATRAVPVVVVPALPADAPPRRVAAAAHPVVAKPFRPARLLAAVRGALDRG